MKPSGPSPIPQPALQPGDANGKRDTPIITALEWLDQIVAVFDGIYILESPSFVTR
jgi:hypothetical protein